MTDTTDDQAPWERERYIIARTRKRLKRATKPELQAALTVGLDRATDIIRIHERHTEAEWLFQRAVGATEVVTAIGRRLDRP